MSEEFSVGDVVVCVDARPPTCIGRSPAVVIHAGGLYKITDILLAADGPSLLINGEAPHTCVCHWGDAGWAPRRFRKLPRADEEFTRQMRACQPQRTPVPAGMGRGK